MAEHTPSWKAGRKLICWKNTFWFSFPTPSWGSDSGRALSSQAALCPWALPPPWYSLNSLLKWIVPVFFSLMGNHPGQAGLGSGVSVMGPGPGAVPFGQGSRHSLVLGCSSEEQWGEIASRERTTIFLYNDQTEIRASGCPGSISPSPTSPCL